MKGINFMSQYLYLMKLNHCKNVGIFVIKNESHCNRLFANYASCDGFILVFIQVTDLYQSLQAGWTQCNCSRVSEMAWNAHLRPRKSSESS